MARKRTVEELLDEGHSFNVDIPEVEKLTAILDQLKWNQKAESFRAKHMTLADLATIKPAAEASASPNPLPFHLETLRARGWRRDARAGLPRGET